MNPTAQFLGEVPHRSNAQEALDRAASTEQGLALELRMGQVIEQAAASATRTTSTPAASTH